MRLPRFIHRLYAYCLGYFWLPCPVCGEYTGGHECSEVGGLKTSPNRAWVTCKKPSCVYASGVVSALRVFEPMPDIVDGGYASWPRSTKG